VQIKFVQLQNTTYINLQGICSK